MKFFIRISCFLVMCCILPACGPVFRTNYSYVPPKGQMGQMCISQCIQSQSTCNQMCEMKNQNCRMQARQNALLEYEIYKRDHNNQGGHRTIDSFDRGSWTCNQGCGCEDTYRSCYTACGGQVIANTVCVANCDKIGK